jgi:pyruvate-formate lyase-activating enzyme
MRPYLVLADRQGHIFTHPRLKMLGSSAGFFSLPMDKELVPLPEGSSFFFMPGHLAFGWDDAFGEAVAVATFQGQDVYPVAAFCVPGFTRLYWPAAKKIDPRVTLPLWPYTAVGWERGRFFAAAVAIDAQRRQRPFYYRRDQKIEEGIKAFQEAFPDNRLLKHLVHCSRTYQCRNAQDLFLGRGEAPLPASPSCNAQCLGCISDAGCEVASSHERISFVPSAQELAELAVVHIKNTRGRGLVSFGQGCEGEPLLEFETIREAIRQIRSRTKAGTIHMNTNGAMPDRLKRLAAAGLDSVRISTLSFRRESYDAYYRPRGYGLQDVCASFRLAKKSGLFVSLNLLVAPGFTDRGSEARALGVFLKKGFVDLVQWRNLSMDPEVFFRRMPASDEAPRGLRTLMNRTKRGRAGLRYGYFNLPKQRFGRARQQD